MSANQQGQKKRKERPPGSEQLLLEDMFESGSITSHATAETVRQSSEMFKQFTPRVFAVHFRKTKARLGEFVSDKNIPGVVGGVIPPDSHMEKTAGGYGQIGELGSNVPSTITKRTTSSKPEAVVEIINPPYSTLTTK